MLPALLGIDAVVARWRCCGTCRCCCSSAGSPFFVLALADPFTALVSREESFSGRRIGLMIDASISMRTPFTAATSQQAGGHRRRVLHDRRRRRAVRPAADEGPVTAICSALVEFGNQAYVVTPFTSDYDNILLSISLIGDPVEFSMFPDQGTIIAQAIDQIVGLFKAFNFLDASGNIMVIFSDGEDTHSQLDGQEPRRHRAGGGRREDSGLFGPHQLRQGRRARSFPTRCGFRRSRRPAASSTPPAAKTALLAAIEDIDKVSTGTIQVKQYSSQQPRFAIFAMIALGCWSAAIALKLVVPHFQKLT